MYWLRLAYKRYKVIKLIAAAVFFHNHNHSERLKIFHHVITQ